VDQIGITEAMEGPDGEERDVGGSVRLDCGENGGNISDSKSMSFTRSDNFQNVVALDGGSRRTHSTPG
jgi:hypothetical protein